jgi:hypothetical protein
MNTTFTSIQSLRANSFEDVYLKASEARKILLEKGKSDDGIKSDEQTEIWYRGVPKSSYSLIPSLLRYPQGEEYEDKLYRQFLEHRVPEKRDWHALFEMQHYFIPTRLLDWTPSFGVALHFALNSNDPLDSPTIWVLHPGILNNSALLPKEKGTLFLNGQPKPLTIEELDLISLQYNNHYIQKSSKVPDLPLAILPEAAFPRLRAQRGRFTVHGRKSTEIEALCPKAIMKITICNSAIEQIRDNSSISGIDAYSIFPDVVGLANFLCNRYGLSTMAQTRKVVDKLKILWRQDINILVSDCGKHGKSTPQVSNTGIENCVVSNDYITRESNEGVYGVESLLKQWFSSNGGGIRVLTGEAGSGKTNCILNALVGQKLYENHVVIWFPLFRFEVQAGLVWNLHEYLKSIFDEPKANFTIAISELLCSSNTIIVLDGLDELSRTKGKGAAKALATTLLNDLHIGDEDSNQEFPKVLISCRADIFAGLKKDFNIENKAIIGPIEPLSIEAIKLKYTNLSNAEDVIEFLSNYPIFLRFLSLDSLPNSIPTKSSKLFESLTPKDIRQTYLISLGMIAKEMLNKRQDYLTFADFEKIVKKYEIQSDNFFLPKPMQALLREKNGDIRFLHHTIREFVLAWNIRFSLTISDLSEWNLLSETSDLDYEGAEVHRAVDELEPSFDWQRIKALCTKHEDWNQRNNFTWCSFETAGILGVKDSSRKEVLDWIYDVFNGPLDGSDSRYSFNAKYNAARCLERIHPSAPPCYWKWIVSHGKKLNRKSRNHIDRVVVPKEANADGKTLLNHFIYAYAVRGFQRLKLAFGVFPPMEMYDNGRRGESDIDNRQKDFSEILLHDIESLSAYAEISDDQSYVLVNMAYAYIRWYSKDHYQKVKALIDKPCLISIPDINAKVKANLRFALWYWHPNVEDKTIFLENGKVMLLKDISSAKE